MLYFSNFGHVKNMAVYDATDKGKKVYMSQKLYLDYGPKSFASLMADFCQYLNRDIDKCC